MDGWENQTHPFLSMMSGWWFTCTYVTSICYIQIRWCQKIPDYIVLNIAWSTTYLNVSELNHWGLLTCCGAVQYRDSADVMVYVYRIALNFQGS